MSVDVKNEPTDAEGLKELVTELRRQLNHKELEYKELEEKYKVLRQRFFG
jgi:hypothetical protein